MENRIGRIYISDLMSVNSVRKVLIDLDATVLSIDYCGPGYNMTLESDAFDIVYEGCTPARYLLSAGRGWSGIDRKTMVTRV